MSSMPFELAMTQQVLNEQHDVSWQRCRNCSMMSSMTQDGDDAMRPPAVSLCFPSNEFPQEHGSGKDVTANKHDKMHKSVQHQVGKDPALTRPQ
jgi:hypothetical protein